MDGPHDLGGRQGFGPVDVDAPPFRHDWERRQWALSKNVAVGYRNIDHTRWILEQIPPAHYLAAPYFEKWCLRDMAGLILAGQVTLDEAVAGHATTQAPPAAPRDLAAAREALKANEAVFDRPATAPPRFAPGDRVRTARAGPRGHTRLPAYARAAQGTVTAHHGAHLFPDACAHGTETAHHLYTVAFAASDLWDDADPRDEVRLDLWEPYLDAP
ncbi:nitrile hydratase subunit beta [Rhodobacteraceae bacterium CCMM004]|nr:nitrile hydratase subunit beta [Rhodobacteraceae bacterium CCMM004]